MITAPIRRHDLRRRLDGTAKAEKDWRFWGRYVQGGKMETLRAAYALAKPATGAPGIDGVTVAASAAAGVEAFLAALRDALVTRTYRPLRHRRVASPTGGGRVRVLGSPALRDRVVQGGRKLIVAPIVAADVPDGSCG